MYACYGPVNLIPFEGRLIFPGASSWTNMKAYIWDSEGKPAPIKVFFIETVYDVFYSPSTIELIMSIGHFSSDKFY